VCGTIASVGGRPLRSARSFVLRACVSLILVLAGRTARAQTDAVVLEVRTQLPSTVCLDAEALRRAIAQRLGRDPFSPAAPRRVEVEWRDAQPWRAIVRITEPDGSTVVRRLTVRGEDCAPLVEAVTLAVTLAIDPDWAAAPPPRVEPSPPPSAVAAATPCRSDPSAVATLAMTCPSPSPVRSRPGLALRFVAGGSAGLVGRLGASAALEGEVLLNPITSVLIAARFTPPRTSDNGAVSVGLTRADLGACVRTDARLSLGGCVGLSLGAL
jgi:hypothetical protein